jgi:hypothetical protein
MRIIVSAVMFFVFLGTAFAQLPQCAAVSGWQQQGPVRSYDAGNLFEYMNGNSEAYFVYNFAEMKGVSCQSGNTTIVIDISDMSDPEYAYGMFASTRDPRLPIEKIGISGQVTPRRAFFAKDKWYVELTANPEGDHTAALRAFMTLIEKSISGQTEIPQIISWFPKERLKPESVRLVPESVLGLRLLKKGYVGQYEFGKGFIVSESSPEAAAEVMKKLKDRIGQTAPASLADESFTAKDKYLNGMFVFRKGRFLAGFADLIEGFDAAAEAAKLAAALPK